MEVTLLTVKRLLADETLQKRFQADSNFFGVNKNNVINIAVNEVLLFPLKYPDFEINKNNIINILNLFFTPWVLSNPLKNTPERLIISLSEVISELESGSDLSNELRFLKEVIIKEYIPLLLENDLYKEGLKSEEDIISILSSLKNSRINNKPFETFNYISITDLLELTAFTEEDRVINEKILEILQNSTFDIPSNPESIRNKVVINISDRRKASIERYNKDLDFEKFTKEDRVLQLIYSSVLELLENKALSKSA